MTDKTDTQTTPATQAEIPTHSRTGRPLHDYRPHAYLQLLGIARVIPDEWDSLTEMVVDERHVNPNGAAHGGSIFSLMDTCMSGALRKYIKPPEYSATIECKINYLKAAKKGSILLCASRIVQRGGRVAVIESEVRDETDALVAKGLSTYMVMRPKAEK